MNWGEPSPIDLAYRIQCFDTLSDRLPRDTSWLDVGAGTGWVSRALASRFSGPFECIDIEPRHESVKYFNGRELEYATGAFDVVLFSYVLHHVPRDAREQLLRDAFGIARAAVVLIEDLRNGTEEVDLRLRGHEPHGEFLSQEEWRALLSKPQKEVYFKPLEPLEGDPYAVPRGLFISTTVQSQIRA